MLGLIFYICLGLAIPIVTMAVMAYWEWRVRPPQLCLTYFEHGAHAVEREYARQQEHGNRWFLATLFGFSISGATGYLIIEYAVVNWRLS